MPLASLNAEQLAAATAKPGYNLVIASAGTGKTSTIVGRIAHLLNSGVCPDEILLLTFTNKAAAEMIQRVARHFGNKSASEIEAGTFHSVSYRLLKQRESGLNLKSPSELKTLFRSLFERREIARLGFGVKPLAAAFLYELYTLYQNATLEPFDAWLVERYEEQECYLDIYVDVIAEFEESKRAYGFLHFNDLLIRMREAVREKPLGYAEILIDEYQDTNALQGSLVDAMQPRSLFCVGDYDQSIYAFNGADIAIIGSFADKYRDAKVFSLKSNYRSTRPILSLANRVIGHNARLYAKELEVVRTEPGEAPKLLVYEMLADQYASIAGMIRKTMIPHNQIAVLFRNNASADGIEALLKQQGIASLRKGSSSFFDAKEVKAALNCAVLLVNEKDLMAFIHLFEYVRGVGSATAKELFESLQQVGEGSLMRGLLDPKGPLKLRGEAKTNRQLALFGTPQILGSVSRFSGEGLPETLLAHPILKHPRVDRESAWMLHYFIELVKECRRVKSSAKIMEKIVDSKFMQAIIKILAHNRATRNNGEVDETLMQEAMERIGRRTALLKQLAASYNSLESFVNALVLGAGEISEGEGVNLLSVHASKGLEFSEVYLIDLMDGRFPNRKLMNQGGDLEEERRLFYVAVTRAKNRLFLSYARRDTLRNIEYKPSPFLYEAGLLKDTSL